MPHDACLALQPTLHGRRADEETKERAQKAKAELVGKQQASLANAAVAATLGGKSKGKVNKWDKWSTAAAAGPAAGGEASGAAGGKGKKAGGKKGGGKKGAAAADSEGGSEGGAAAGSDVSGAAAADGKAKVGRWSSTVGNESLLRSMTNALHL